MEGIDAHLKARAATIELLTNDPVARGGFTQVPNFILRHKELSVGAKMTYAMFLSYAWHNKFCFPGQAKMAIDMGASLRSVNSYILELPLFHRTRRLGYRARLNSRGERILSPE